MTKYQSLLIYYFSGTGNAMSAARWIGDHARTAGVTTQVLNIEELGDKEVTIPPLNGKTLIGFCFPTHGFAAPWLMLKFLARFPRVSGADLFFLNTRAGFRLWKLVAGPGLSGLAMWLPMVLFWLRGYSIVGSLPLDMPHSWISFFWPNTMRGRELIVARCRRIVSTFSERLLQGRRYYRWSIWLTLPLDLAVSPIVPLYLFLGRFMLAKTLFASYTCSDCDLCEKYCPIGAIERKGGRPYWKYSCESCMRCMNICPKKSIQSWVTRLALYGYLIMAVGIPLVALNSTLWFIIATISVFPLYRLMHELWRWKPINVLFTFTSLTRAWNRYLAPGVKAKDFRGSTAPAPKHDDVSERTQPGTPADRDLG
ncbi:MAG: EFR1 family ferrodoxin [Pseudomonadota bacterium]